MDANEYRCNQVCKWQSELKTVVEQYTLKVKIYRRRVVVLDVMVYSVYAVVASARVILAAITVTTVIAVTICVSSSTIIAEVFDIIAKKISKCANTKLHNYMVKLNTDTTTYQKLSSLISSSLDARSSFGGIISDSEFELMASTYNDFLNSNLNLKTQQINNGNGTTSTNSRKYNPGENHNDNSIFN